MAITYQETQQLTVSHDDLAQRLQVEKKVLFNQVYQEGFELGIRSCSKLSEADYRHFERVSPLADSLDEEVLEYLWNFLDRRGYPQQARLHHPDFADVLAVDPESHVVFVQGWLEGVLSIWHTIKAQMNCQ